MKILALAVSALLFLLIGCSPSDSYKPAAERQYESAEPATEDSTRAPSDSTAKTDEEEDNSTEEVIIKSL